jgi:hypothetical protein
MYLYILYTCILYTFAYKLLNSVQKHSCNGGTKAAWLGMAVNNRQACLTDTSHVCS